MTHRYWVEWFDTWTLWLRTDSGSRCWFMVRQDPAGWWRIDRVLSHSADDRAFVGRYKDLERAKARAVVEMLFPKEK